MFSRRAMWSSRLLWKLLIVCVGLNVVASAAFGFMFSRDWLAGLLVIVAIAAAAAAWWLRSAIIRPVASLSDAADAIAAGNYEHRVYVDNADELGALARAFNRVAHKLERRRAQLGETGERHSTVLGGMIEGVIAVDARQRIVLANAAAEQLFHFNAAAAEGRPLLEVVRQYAWHEAVTRALASGEPQRLETRSNNRHVDVHVQPLAGDPRPGAVLVMHDTTELRRLESLRRDFVANVSHELKTPLSSIKAYAETLRNGALAEPETAQRFLSRIEEQSDRLHHLIVDMLTLARIESDQQAFETVAVDVPAVVRAALEDHRVAADAKSIRLESAAEQPECHVRADREALRNMLDNLVDNAIKYTPEGGEVMVGCEVQRAGAGGRAVVRIAVRDTGIGIEPEDQRRVFERFYRVDKARSRELGGTGLGLAIVKHLAQAFGGKVSVESEPGKGSTFTVELPAA